jgi:hypothetical protein
MDEKIVHTLEFDKVASRGISFAQIHIGEVKSMRRFQGQRMCDY